MFKSIVSVVGEFFSRCPMHILQVSTQVSTLSKRFLTKRTFEGSEASVFSKMISEIATFFECASTVRVLALKIQFYSLCFRIFNSNSLVPLFGYSFECFMLVSS